MIIKRSIVGLNTTHWPLVVLKMGIQTSTRKPSHLGLRKSTLHCRLPGLKKNWNSVRALESTSLYSQHSTQLEDHIRAKTTNVLEKVCIENVRIKEFIENPDGNDTLVVILSSTLRDYVIDDETRRVLEGDPKKDLFTVYQLNFIRQHGSQTQAVNPDEVVSDHCPNCGAPLKISAVSECDYCGANLSRSPNQWVLDTYDVVDEDELYN